MPENIMGDAELALAKSLAEICGQDLEKLASAKGEDLDFDAMLRRADPETVPGLQKIASALDIEMKDLVEDPNFREGVNHELDGRKSDWVPFAMKLAGLKND